MRERRLTKQQVWDALDCPEDVCEDSVLTTYVYKDRTDGTFWRFSVKNDLHGDAEDNTLAIEVEPVQVTVTQYQVKE